MTIEDFARWLYENPGLMCLSVSLIFFILAVIGGIDSKVAGVEVKFNVDRDGQKRSVIFGAVFLLLSAIIIAAPLIPFLKPDENVRISGTVKDWNGYPIKNADVRALPVGISNRTDPSGYFIIFNVPIDKVDYLQIKRDVTNEIIAIHIPDDKKKDNIIELDDIRLQPKRIELFGDIRDYTGQPTGVVTEISVLYGRTYLTNISIEEFGKYDTYIYSNATKIFAYNINGEKIYESALEFSTQEIEKGQKISPIFIPSKATIDFHGIVYNTTFEKRLVNATVKIGNESNRTNESGYYEMFEVPRSSKSWHVISANGQINKTGMLSDRGIYLTKPNYLYFVNATLWLRVRS